MSNENPTENPREVFDENEAGIAQKKQEMTDAVAAGDYGKVAELAQDAKAMEGANKEIYGNDYDEAAETNKGIDETKAAEEKASREAALTEATKQDAENSQKEAAALLEKLKNGNGESSNSESKGELSPEVQAVIKKMIREGYYEDELPNLKPGEVPSPHLASRMIMSAFYGARFGDDSPFSNFKLSQAEALVKNLPFEREHVEKSLEKDIMESVYLGKGHIKEMEMIGMDPKSLHDQAKESLHFMLQLVAGERGEIRTPEDVKGWRETFGISDEEYADALHSYWQTHTNQISDDHLFNLGFIKRGANGESQSWAWDAKNRTTS